MQTSEILLAERARTGDTAAFEEIVSRYYADCLRFATRMLGNRADAEEAVQDTFVRAYRALPRYDERQRLRSWIYRILVNRCRSLARRRSNGWALLTRLRELAVWDARRRTEPSLGIMNGAVGRALRSLPAEQREAFLLKHIEELTYPEMAEVTGAGVPALKMRVKRACDRLRVLLTEGNDD